MRYCHPPKSVHVVLEIVESFRAGAQDTANFWIDMHGTFITISYYAVRDDTGAFRGVLEVSTDATQLRRPTDELRADTGRHSTSTTGALR